MMDTYTVKPGDTLSGIAAHHLGDGMRWRDIYAANRSEMDLRFRRAGLPKHTIRHPWDYVVPGQVLRLPAKDLLG